MAALESHYTLPLPAFDKPVRLLIVVAPYYRDIADNLITGARATAAACGAATLRNIPVCGVMETGSKSARRPGGW